MSNLDKEIAKAIIKVIAEDPELRKELLDALSGITPLSSKVPSDTQVEAAGGIKNWLMDQGMSTRSAVIISRRGLKLSQLMTFTDSKILEYQDIGSHILEEWKGIKSRLLNE